MRIKILVLGILALLNPHIITTFAGETAKHRMPCFVCRYGRSFASFSFVPRGPAYFIKKQDAAVVDGRSCLKCSINIISGWGGGTWEYRTEEPSDARVGLNLSGAHRLVFMARGAGGRETVIFSYGISGDRTQVNTSHQTMTVALASKWKQYSFDLQGQDLSRIRNAFTCVAVTGHHPVVFYLDDIRYE